MLRPNIWTVFLADAVLIYKAEIGFCAGCKRDLMETHCFEK